MSNPLDGPLCPYCDAPLVDRGDIATTVTERMSLGGPTDVITVTCGNCRKLLAMWPEKRSPRRRR